jgi:hypothetical protein
MLQIKLTHIAVDAGNAVCCYAYISDTSVRRVNPLPIEVLEKQCKLETSNPSHLGFPMRMSKSSTDFMQLLFNVCSVFQFFFSPPRIISQSALIYLQFC